MAKRRQNGKGMLRERKDGRWEGRVVIGYDEKGLPKTKKCLGKNQDRVYGKTRKVKRRIRRGR